MGRLHEANATRYTGESRTASQNHSAKASIDDPLVKPEPSTSSSFSRFRIIPQSSSRIPFSLETILTSFRQIFGIQPPLRSKNDNERKSAQRLSVNHTPEIIKPVAQHFAPKRENDNGAEPTEYKTCSMRGARNGWGFTGSVQCDMKACRHRIHTVIFVSHALELHHIRRPDDCSHAERGVTHECIARSKSHTTGVAIITRVYADNSITIDAGANASTCIDAMRRALDEVD